MIFKKKTPLASIESSVMQIVPFAESTLDYASLQELEGTLRRFLFTTLEAKSRVAEILVKKDIELNKELLAKLHEQGIKKSISTPTQPRFKDN